MSWHCFSLIASCILAAVLLVSVGANGRRIVAVGDLHGDFNQSCAVLRLSRLIDNNNQWIGEDAYLVQLGDILDVGPDDILIVRLLMKLQKQAEARGGDVIQLLGNHELRNFQGDYTAVDPASLATCGGQKGRDDLLSNKSIVGRYLRTRKAIFHHGPFLFMHGGFSMATASMLTSLKRVDEFNTEIGNALLNGTISPLASGGLNLAEDNIDGVANPILVRSILTVKCNELEKVLDQKFPGIQSVVVGHVPHDSRDFGDWRLCGGQLIDIDFGLSRWKKGDPGHVAALEIDDPSWHTQLLEATLSYGTPVGDEASSPSWQYGVIGVVMFVGMVSLAIAFVLYIKNLRHKQASTDLLNNVDAPGYGAVP